MIWDKKAVKGLRIESDDHGPTKETMSNVVLQLWIGQDSNRTILLF